MVKPLQNKAKGSFYSKLSTSLDFNGSDFNLEFSSKNGKLQTKFGGYLTLIGSFTIILIFILSVSELFSDDSPIVNTTTELNTGVVDINLYEQDLVMPLMFKKGKKLISSTQELSKYLTVNTYTADWGFNPDTGKWKLNSAPEFQLIPCSQLGTKNSRITELIKDLLPNAKNFKKYLFCPNLGENGQDFKIRRFTDKSDMILSQIRLYPCSLKDVSKCADPSGLQDLEVTIFQNKKILEASNLENPIKNTLKRYRYNLDPEDRKSLKFYSWPHVVVDDSNQIRSTKERMNFSAMELVGDNKRSREPPGTYCTQEQVSGGPFSRCTPYIEVDYFPMVDLVKMRRSYKKASIVLGEFGGSLKLAMTLFVLFYSIYSSKGMKRYVIETMFPHRTKSPKRATSGKTESEGIAMQELSELTVDAVNFLQKMNKIEFLEKLLLEEDDAGLINDSILNKLQAEESKSDQKILIGSSPINRQPPIQEGTKGTLEGLKKPLSLSEAYKKIKSDDSGAENSKIRFLVNQFILKHVEQDFDNSG